MIARADQRPQKLDEVSRFLRHLSIQDRLTEAAERSLAEQNELLGSYVDPRERYIDDDGSQWLPAGGGGVGGKNRPPWDFQGFSTEQELDNAREVCRRMLSYSEHVINGHQNRINYCVDTGHKYTAAAKKGQTAREEIVRENQEFVDEFCRLNKWFQRQQETVLRYDRDGEVFRRKFFPSDQVMRVRFIEPWQVTDPAEPGENISFGVETEADDAETVVAYHITTDAGQRATERVPAEEVQHLKANVDLNARRGVPLFWPCRKNVVRAYQTLRNIASKSEMAAALCLLRRHQSGTSASVSTFASAAATGQRVDPTTNTTKNVRKWGPQTTLDVSANVEYEAANLAEGIEEMIAGLQETLRAIAAVAQMPEFMLTSNASNANYSSTMVAEGPAVRSFSRMQKTISEADLELINQAREYAEKAGRLPSGSVEMVEIQVGLPDLATVDQEAEARRNEVLAKNGVLSPQGWAAQAGLDYEQEQKNIEEHAAKGRKMPGEVPAGLAGGGGVLGPDGKPVEIGPDGKPVDPDDPAGATGATGAAAAAAMKAKMEACESIPEMRALFGLALAE